MLLKNQNQYLLSLAKATDGLNQTMAEASAIAGTIEFKNTSRVLQNNLSRELDHGQHLIDKYEVYQCNQKYQFAIEMNASVYLTQLIRCQKYLEVYINKFQHGLAKAS